MKPAHLLLLLLLLRCRARTRAARGGGGTWKPDPNEWPREPGIPEQPLPPNPLDKQG